MLDIHDRLVDNLQHLWLFAAVLLWISMLYVRSTFDVTFGSCVFMSRLEVVFVCNLYTVFSLVICDCCRFVAMAIVCLFYMCLFCMYAALLMLISGTWVLYV